MRKLNAAILCGLKIDLWLGTQNLQILSNDYKNGENVWYILVIRILDKL